jgi:hypothetical protein
VCGPSGGLHFAFTRINIAPTILVKSSRICARLCQERAHGARCCTRDEGGPFGQLSVSSRWYPPAVKLLGGQWSRGDLLALIAVIAAVLAIPGMPKLFHWDSDAASKQGQTPEPGARTNVLKPVQRVKDVSSSQVSFGCDQSLPVETPVVSFGKNPRDIETRPAWANTDNVKAQNQSVARLEDPADHRIIGVKGVGTITGRDSQSVLGIKNCPGGGHGELTLHVSWTEDQ